MNFHQDYVVKYMQVNYTYLEALTKQLWTWKGEHLQSSTVLWYVVVDYIHLGTSHSSMFNLRSYTSFFKQIKKQAMLHS
jgi:hypothetical protein